MKNNFKWPRIITGLAALLLTGAIFLPLWQIQLSAPQYPEGLTLKIFPNGLSGDVDVINGLNHYIGMNTLHSEDFEFTLLPYIIGGLVLFGFLAVVINKKKFYYAYIALFMLVAIISMVDFYRWEYNYGHNLDPNAAIVVPGMAYQPPLIGYKQLLNFGAYSIPDIGGWLFIGAALLLVIAYLLLLQPRWLTIRKTKLAVASIILVTLHSCNAGPQPIKYGSDPCDFCKMTIMDKKFACEWVTNKGKPFRFDDLKCLMQYRAANKVEGAAYINDFTASKELQNAAGLYYVKSDRLKTPMGGHIAAFTDSVTAASFAADSQGSLLSWEMVERTFIK